MKFSKVLVDGDILVYRAAFVNESRYYLCNDPVTGEMLHWCKSKKEMTEWTDAYDYRKELDSLVVVSPLSYSIYNINSMLKKIKADTQCDNLEIYLTDSDINKNFRSHVATYAPYKGNRKGSKPKHYNSIRQYLVDKHNAKVVSGYEADDAMGCAQTKDTVIASIDKDMLMIDGWHYNIHTQMFIECKGEGDLHLYKDNSGAKKLQGTGFKWFCAQMFMGDDVDNIIGLKGYGPVKAFSLLEDKETRRDMWAVVKKHYYRQGQIERLLENAMLLWIWPNMFETFIPERILAK